MDGHGGRERHHVHYIGPFYMRFWAGWRLTAELSPEKQAFLCGLWLALKPGETID